MRKEFLSIFFILLLIFMQDAYAQYNVVRIRFPASTYSAQLRGVTGTTTAGLTIQGTYSSNLGAHVFKITITGPYKLYFDAAGGSSYSLDSQWSDTYGTTLTGYPDLMNATDFVSKVDPDGNDSLSAVFIEDSTFALRKLTTAAYNFIASGGSVTNNPDDVTLENKGGSTLGIKDNYLGTQLQFKDTTQLKAATSDSAGMVVHLKQLSSANTKGGGAFQFRPAAEFTVDGVVCFASGSGSYELVRQDWLREKVLYTDWAGITANDSTGNPAKWATLWARAVALDAQEIVFPPGKTKFDDSLAVSQNGSGSAAFAWIHGAGAGAAGTTTGNSIIEFTGNTNGFVFEDGFMPRISDLKIINALGKSSNTGIGIRIMKDNGVTNGSLLGQVSRCDIEQWFVGLHLSQPNSILVESNYIRDNRIGIREINAPNEIVYVANYIAFNDSIQIYKNAGNKSTFLGGSISGPSGASQDYGIYVDNAGKVALFGVSSERCGHSVIYAGTNTWVEWNSGGGTYSTANTNRFATVNGGNLVLKGRITFSDVPADTHAIWQSGTGSRVYADQTATMRTRWTNYNLTYYPNNTQSIPGSGTVANDSTGRGKEYTRLYQASTYSDKPYRVIRMSTGDYVAMPVLAGSDWMRSTNFSNQPTYAATLDLAFRTGSANVTMSGGDSTVFTTVVDTNGWTAIYGRGCQVDLSNTALADSVYDWNIVGLDAVNTAGTGTITWIVHHPYYSGTGTFQFGFWAIITPRRWTR